VQVLVRDLGLELVRLLVHILRYAGELGADVLQHADRVPVLVLQPVEGVLALVVEAGFVAGQEE